MIKKKSKIEPPQPNKNPLIEALERLGVGILYAATDLGQNDIARIMGMGNGRVNGILKGIKKPKK